MSQPPPPGSYPSASGGYPGDSPEGRPAQQGWEMQSPGSQGQPYGQQPPGQPYGQNQQPYGQNQQPPGQSYGQQSQGQYPPGQPYGQQPPPLPPPDQVPAGATGRGIVRGKLWIPLAIGAAVLIAVVSVVGLVAVANWSTPERTATQYVTAASDADCERLLELSSDEWDARLDDCEEAEAQPAEITAIAETNRQGDLAQVQAQLSIDGRPTVVTFVMVKEGADWKVQSVSSR